MVKVNTLGKKHSYSHKYNSALNTTSNFGTCQPIFVRALAKDDKVSITPNLVTRCAPMVAPAMANFNTHIRATFVPYSDVFEPYDAVKTGQKYMDKNTFIYPMITNNQLFMWLLCTGCFALVPVMNTSTSSTGKEVQWTIFDNNEITKVDDIINAYLSAYWEYDNGLLFYYTLNDFISSCKTYNYYVTSDVTLYSSIRKSLPNGTAVSLDSFDVVLHTSSMTESSSTGWSLGLIANNKGKQIIKLLRGLGYNPLAYYDNDRVNCLPLFCLAKALFCMNSIQLEANWTNSNWYYVLRSLRNSSLGWNMSGLGASYNFCAKILDELYTYSFFTNRTDAWTLCRPKPSYSNACTQYSSTPQRNVPTGIIDNGDSITTDSYGNVSTSGTNAIAIQTALRLAKYFNSGSVFGQKISAYLRSKGYEVDQTIFNDTPIIYDKVEEVSINEVFSQSDTYDGENGSELGAYAGRGVSTSKSNFKYTAQKDGLLIMWYALVPRVGMCLSTSPYLYNVNKYTWKDSVFDGLGIELSPCGCHEQALPFSFTKSLALGAYQNKGFGFQPRLTIWKQVPDLLSGDMALHSNFNSYLPYHDEMIVENATQLANGDWTRKPWSVIDYNRFFYTEGQLTGAYATSYDAYATTIEEVQQRINYDNFLVQGMIYVTERNQLKPISESYETSLDGFNESTSELV